MCAYVLRSILLRGVFHQVLVFLGGVNTLSSVFVCLVLLTPIQIQKNLFFYPEGPDAADLMS